MTQAEVGHDWMIGWTAVLAESSDKGKYHQYTVRDSKGNPVCDIYYVDGRGKPQADLIAAAPALLAACERCIMALAANGAPNCEAVKEARAATSKARAGAA